MIVSKKNQAPEHENSDSDCSEDSEIIDEESRILLNEGWADSIAKILRTNKPKKKKTLVLSKAKKLTDPVRTVQPESFQVATLDGQVKQPSDIPTQTKKKEPVIIKIKQKNELNLRVKPSILDKARERTLQKIATRGAVQLFNAVKSQQNDISKKLDEAGPLSTRKEKVLKNIDKRAFLDVLMGEKSQPISLEQSKPEANKGWDVLRDDFQMSAKMKDWDKELEQEMEIESE